MSKKEQMCKCAEEMLVSRAAWIFKDNVTVLSPMLTMNSTHRHTAMVTKTEQIDAAAHGMLNVSGQSSFMTCSPLIRVLKTTT